MPSTTRACSSPTEPGHEKHDEEPPQPDPPAEAPEEAGAGGEAAEAGAAAGRQGPRLIGAAGTHLSFLGAWRNPFAGSPQAAALAAVDTRKWSAPLLKQLEWRRFEELCAAYFELLGFRTRSAPSGAGGADIHLSAAGSDRTSIVLHGKAWDAHRIGIKAARELRSAMASAQAREGVLVTSGRFTQEAIDYARKEGIELIDGAGLLAKIDALVPENSLALLKLATQGDFLTPTCPDCSIKMTPRTSTREGRKFWGCSNYPRCKHTLPGTAHSFT
jgi:restriction system protein